VQQRHTTTNPAAHKLSARRRRRNGFTLAELLVALLLLDCALLALVSTSAAITRWLGAAGAAAHAAAATIARVERLASQSCAAATAGSTVDARGMREWWTVRIDDNGTRLLTDSAEYPSGRGTRRIAAASTRMLC
jgi:Tfp pilus assembly protein PilV